VLPGAGYDMSWPFNKRRLPGKMYQANMPCRGCYGPTGNVKDMGGKFLSAFASIIETNDEKELERIAESILDVGDYFIDTLFHLH